jgi:glucose uptake protein GlcU
MPPQQQDPGKTLGIVGLVLSFFTALIGMIISIIAYRSSKKAGFKNGPALAGIIIGAVFTVGAIIGTIALVAVVSKVAADCSQLGPGVHVVTGVTYRCG